MTGELKPDNLCSKCAKFKMKSGFKVCEQCYRLTMLKINNDLKQARYRANFDSEE